MNSSVIVFPGSNCDRDIAVALEKLNFQNKMVWHKDTSLPKSDLIVIPGGFSYGDYLRSGAIAGKSNILNEVIKVANDGCLILGICNGFQILKLNIAHNEGNYSTNKEHLKELEDKNLISFKYCGENGDINEENNPNGSMNNIAGIFNDKKNILGLMPHPERMVDQVLSNNDGINLFTSLLN